jgi:hypothetical protein
MIELTRQEGVSEDVWNNLAEISNAEFNVLTSNPTDYVSFIAQQLQRNYPMRDILDAGYTWRSFNADAIHGACDRVSSSFYLLITITGLTFPSRIRK